MAIDDTDEAFLAIKQMRELVANYLASGGKITHCKAYQTTPQSVLYEPPPRKGPGRPKKIVVDIAPPTKRKAGRPKTVIS